MRTDKQEELRQGRNRVDQEGQEKKDDNTSAVGACAEVCKLIGSSFVKTTARRVSVKLRGSHAPFIGVERKYGNQTAWTEVASIRE